ncbi:hypothetical protein IKI14_05995 [bacterium]|nr:hypothetical protein [bacterium]
MAGEDAATMMLFQTSLNHTTETSFLISLVYHFSKTCLADQDKKAELTSM